MKFKKCLYLFLIFICIYPANAQFSGYGNDQCQQTAVEMIDLDHVPPMHTDMSYDCMIGYIAMDSIARNANVGEIYDRAATATTDSLKVAARFMYAVSDYSALLFRSYATAIWDSADNQRYMSQPANSYYATLHEVLKRKNEIGRNFCLLLQANYIYKVIIDSVVTGTDTTYDKPMEWANVSCTIIERIKGVYSPDNCHLGNPAPRTNIEGQTDECLLFGYPSNFKTGPVADEENNSNEIGEYWLLEKGEEYIVFLEHLRIEESIDMITAVSELEATGGLFRINNGIVEDVSGVFGIGTSPTENEFMNKLYGDINIIKHWWLP